MQSIDQGPRHLAEVVLRALSVTDDELPDRSLLAFFFDVLYQASFRAEQGRFPVGCVLWQDPATISFAPLRSSGSYLALTSPIPFNVNSYVEMAAVTDLRMSALLVYPTEKGRPLIHGLLNFGLDFGGKRFLPPGAFRATVQGPAHLTVDAGPDYQVELKQNALHTHAPEVLRHGPIRERFCAGLSGLLPLLRAQLPPTVSDSRLLETQALRLPDGVFLFDDDDWADTLTRVWVDALTHLLRQIQEDGQGGAVLVTPRPAPRPRLKHETEYSHLRLLLERHSAQALAHYLLSAQALSASAVPLQERSPEELNLPEPARLASAVRTEPEVTQALAFAAALARFDGLLLLTPRLDLRGFGGQADGGSLPDEVYFAGDVLGTPANQSPVPARSFGPRAQSLIRHCAQDHEAVGFLVTRDGDLRAVLWEEGRILVWNHVRLHHEWNP